MTLGVVLVSNVELLLIFDVLHEKRVIRDDSLFVLLFHPVITLAVGIQAFRHLFRGGDI